MKPTPDINSVFHLDLLEGRVPHGPLGMPLVRRTQSVPKRLVAFDEALRSDRFDAWVHFYENDDKFVRLARHPWKYLDKLKRFEGVIMPDFTVFWGPDLHLQIQSMSLNRTLASWLQRNGVDVIANPRWGMPDTFNWAFSAIEPGGVCAIGTDGCMRNPRERHVFSQGVPELIKRLEPAGVVVYGSLHDDVAYPLRVADIPIYHFPSRTTLAHKEGGQHGAD